MQTVRVRLADGTEVDAVPVQPKPVDLIKDPVSAENVLAVVENFRAYMIELSRRVTTLEAAWTADDGATDDPVTEPAPFRAIRAHRRELSALKAGAAGLTMKLATRMGLEFAARAGAAPLDRANGDRDDLNPPDQKPKKSAEDVTAEKIRTLGIAK